jgi:hypothetical protein
VAKVVRDRGEVMLEKIIQGGICMKKIVIMLFATGMIAGLGIQHAEAGEWAGMSAADVVFDDPLGEMSNPDWRIELNSFGYSDLLYHKCRDYAGEHEHEMLSGDWMAAVSYDRGKPIWLNKNMICPKYSSNSNFIIDGTITTWDDRDNPIEGNDSGSSKISNEKLQIEIEYRMIDMGEPQNPYDNRYAMIQKYTLQAKQAINDVKFYQFLHAQPGDQYGDTGSVYYFEGEDDPHKSGLRFPNDYNYKMIFRDDCRYCANRDDFVGIAVNPNYQRPTKWKLGTYPGHERMPDWSEKNPINYGPDGLNREVNAGDVTFNGVRGYGSMFYPYEGIQAAGVMVWNLGDMVPGGPEKVIDIAMTTDIAPEPCTMLLMGSGIAGLAGLARRRKKEARN